MSRVELPDDQWMVLWSPKKVKERKRRAYIASMTDLSAATSVLPKLPDGTPDPSFFKSEHMGLSDKVGDQLVLCLVREWSFGDVNAEVLNDLDAEAFDAVFSHCRDLASDLLPDYSAGPRDPKADTGGSPDVPPVSSTDQPTSEIPSSAVTS